MSLPRLLAVAAMLTVASPASAQEGALSSAGQAIGGVFDSLGLRKPPPPAPDFVRQSRPEKMDYVPFAPTPEKDGKKRAAEMQAAGATLDRAAVTARRRAARVNAPD
jgi:hypothetical protein